jgi:hypothetical protein
VDSNNHIIIKGLRDHTKGLWAINLQPHNQNVEHHTTTLHHMQANNVHEFHKQSDVVQYLHQACGCPVPSTWLKAIKADISLHGLALLPASSENIFPNRLPPPKATYDKKAKASALPSQMTPSLAPHLS